jgi:hypothetical protein
LSQIFFTELESSLTQAGMTEEIIEMLSNLEGARQYQHEGRELLRK